MNSNSSLTSPLKIVVIGGTGLIGSKLVTALRQRGHDVVPASPSSGVNTLTGEGLAAALAGVHTVVDVSNSPSFEDRAVLEFFQKTTGNILAAEQAAGVKHHVALSVVGTERLLAGGYFRAKLAQESLIQASGVPYTIVRATQFFEFIPTIAQYATQGSVARLSPAMMQPMFSGDVALLVAESAVSAPVNGIVDIAGPEPVRMDELVRRWFRATNDPRAVVVDPAVGYFGGIPVDDRSLVPQGDARHGTMRFENWLQQGGARK